ncbi:DUF1574 domain-containing protein [Lusitaniella coriacea]|uniref:DUF1574 domain-containing protein n=1 Tax=Lusitaniella coriacea TaxID=1983105 RepID=UPI003CF28C7C
MWDVDRQQKNRHQSSIAHWLYEAISEPNVRLRIRLRGNNLHVLCEGKHAPEAEKIRSRLVRALKAHPESLDRWASFSSEPIYKFILYGRARGKQRPVWIEPVDLNRLQREIVARQSIPEGSESPSKAALPVVSNESLAQTGSTEAIARYLSESFSHLGVSIKVLIQKLPESKTQQRDDEPIADKRLWAICNCDYSPDQSLLAEPIAQKLRDLQLKGFREAVIRSQVRGESTPDWVLQVDLTSPEAMLRDWARWGDAGAIARLLDKQANPHGLQVQTILKDSTLHVFCSLLPSQPKTALEQKTVVALITPMLDAIAPQGIEAATLYGVRGPRFSLNSPETPIWVEWLNLPATQNPELAPAPLALARQKNPEALTFLLQRLLNPDLDTRLATGGIRIKLCYKNNLLHILCEGITCPTQTQVIEPIEDFLKELSIPNLSGVRLYGRRAGQSSALWNHSLKFPSRTSPSTPTATAQRNGSAPILLGLEIDPDELLVPREASSPADATPTVTERQKSAIAQTFDLLCRTLSQGLYQTKLFVPRESDPAAYSQTPANAPGLKTVAIWSIVGLLFTLQVDWLCGRMLRVNSASIDRVVEQKTSGRTFSSSALAAQETNPSGSSLQQTPDGEAEGFNSEQFAQNSDNRAATAAILAAARSSNPSFNNRLLDEKLALYQERLKVQGVPDVLIVGSSRAMRGIDPAVLQQEMAKRGYKDIDIFNFGINGATAQVVDLLLRQVLTPDRLPKLVIWADGARAFNSGRPDRTYDAIASSPGFQQLQNGTFPQQGTGESQSPLEEDLPWHRAIDRKIKGSYQTVERGLNETLSQLSSTYSQREQLKNWLRLQLLDTVPNVLETPSSALDPEGLNASAELIDFNGFLPLTIRFDPQTYYETHPRVPGAYDGDYHSFNVEGEQYKALQKLSEFLDRQQIELVFVNLPLTEEYLGDPVRNKYEQAFTQKMRDAAIEHGIIFRNLAKQWNTQYDFFSDPSHLNRYGAHQVSVSLAQDPLIPWQQ